MKAGHFFTVGIILLVFGFGLASVGAFIATDSMKISSVDGPAAIIVGLIIAASGLAVMILGPLSLRIREIKTFGQEVELDKNASGTETANVAPPVAPSLPAPVNHSQPQPESATPPPAFRYFWVPVLESSIQSPLGLQYARYNSTAVQQAVTANINEAIQFPTKEACEAYCVQNPGFKAEEHGVPL